jgi:hypothetical protein
MEPRRFGIHAPHRTAPSNRNRQPHDMKTSNDCLSSLVEKPRPGFAEQNRASNEPSEILRLTGSQ